MDCNCRVCNNDDAPEIHEICDCLECHDAGEHDEIEQWADVCVVCEGLREEMEAAYESQEKVEDAKKAS